MGQMFRRLLEMHGLDAVGIARQAGVDLATIPSPAERIEVDKIDAILRVAIPLIYDPAFGLQAARCWHPGNLGVLGHAWLSSSTLRTGLQRLARYSRVVGERGATELEATRQGVKVRFWAKRGDPAAVAVAAVFVDVAMALLLDMCRMNAGAALRPMAASLRRGKPGRADAYERFFGCPVRFGAEENAFVLSASDADRPLPSSNKQLAAVFDRMLTEELARLDKSDVVARCRAAVLEHLPSGEASAEDTAKQLHMSPRTLQRKLAEAATTYIQLVDDTRKDLALRYVEDPSRSITDITFSLGFSQPSAFTRAFRRWTGVSPSAFRAKLGNQG
jgi:AraC-like DNA-binding protein